MLSDLLRHRVIFLLGKGGVGTTSVAAALALAAAKQTDGVLAMESDVRGPMAAAFGIKPAFEPVMISDRLFSMVLEGRHSLEEYLRLVVPARTVLRAVFASRLYQFFVQAAPGLKELMALGKIYYEAERKMGGESHWDVIVVDLPASGQALSLLRMPTAAQETFGDSVVGREAGNINRMLRDARQTAVLLVTTPEPLPISETLETEAALIEMGINPAAIVINRNLTQRFASRDVARLKEQLVGSGNAAGAEHLGRIARMELDRVGQAEHALEQLRSHSRVPIIQLPQLHGASGGGLVRTLAQELAKAPTERPSRRASLGG